MAWRPEKTKNGNDFVWDGAEFGVGVSPTKGTANLQNVNISTQEGEVMGSYGRTNQAQVALTSQTLTPDGATLFDAPATLKAGTWIRVSASTVTSITAATNPASVSVDYLVVAGGGGSGGATTYASGGGGAGAMRTGSSSLSVQSYSITVGAGGAGGAPGSNGTNGGNSVFGSIVTATGGGGGGDGNNTRDGSNGGSGGGGGASNTTAGTGGTGTTGGNNGGAGDTSANEVGGGGGGAGAAGGAAVGNTAGNGGNGTASSITGTSVTYAGGGGGGSVSGGNAGTGGTGGGGSGGDGTSGTAGTDGLGGGGGGRGDTGFGSDGGSGIVVISYPTGSMVAVGGTVSYTSTNTVHTFLEDGIFEVVSIATGGLYYVSYKDTSNKIKLSSKYDPTGANAISHGTTGSVTFSTVATPGSAIAKATEKYATATAVEYRYYILDANGYLWVYDTAVYDSSLAASGVATLWMLPDPNNYSTLAFGGFGVLNGWVLAISNSNIYGKQTTDLGRIFVQLENAYLNEPFPTHKNFALVGGQGKMYYCDGNYIGELFPTTSLVTSVANIQSNCSYTASSTTGTISAILSGSLPYDPSADTRIPVVFYTNQYGTLPTAVTQNTVYFLDYNPVAGTFTPYTAITGGSAVDIATGAVGTQYFNTFYPLGLDSGINGTNPLVQYAPQRLNLPANETAQCMVEVGNTVIIGCSGTTLYPWNQIDATPSDVIELPEANVKSMVNVNNMAYVFAGNRGNVYITNNTVASFVLKIPDYCAGVPGTPSTYIEPVFTWGDASYLRGRVYCSILDQTSTKVGNCGGVWSFIPSENFAFGQDIGLSLRLENQNSYGNYNGYVTILIPNQEQDATSPQYWSAWQNSYSTGTSTFGIDYTNTVPVTQYVVETDILPTGTMLEKATFMQLEYKFTSPLATNESVQLYYRLNATDAWATCGDVIEETSNRISGYFNQPFQKTQWTQFRAVVTLTGDSNSSFGRLKEIRLR